MSTVSFFTPLAFTSDIGPKTTLQKATEFFDSYFYFGGRKAVVLNAETKEKEICLFDKCLYGVNEKKKNLILKANTEPSHGITLALKIVSMATGVIPLVMLLGKALCRWKFQSDFGPSPLNNRVIVRVVCSEDMKPFFNSIAYKGAPLPIRFSSPSTDHFWEKWKPAYWGVKKVIVLADERFNDRALLFKNHLKNGPQCDQIILLGKRNVAAGLGFSEQDHVETIPEFNEEEFKAHLIDLCSDKTS